MENHQNLSKEKIKMTIPIKKDQVEIKIIQIEPTAQTISAKISPQIIPTIEEILIQTTFSLISSDSTQEMRITQGSRATTFSLTSFQATTQKITEETKDQEMTISLVISSPVSVLIFLLVTVLSWGE